jgi:hypothetical protein
MTVARDLRAFPTRPRFDSLSASVHHSIPLLAVV